MGTAKTTPLHVAIPHRIEIIQILLEARADPNCQDADPDYNPNWTSKSFAMRLEHRTPLHYSCASGDAAAVSLLAEARARLDIQDAQLNTPLHVAIVEEQLGIIETLVQFRADVNLGNMESGLHHTPL